MIQLLTLLASLAGLLRRDAESVPWDPPEVPIPLGEWLPDTSPILELSPEPDPEMCAKAGCENPAVSYWCSQECHRLWLASWNRKDVA